jgi:hypothetical protein
MSQPGRLLTHGIVLIVATFLWLNPFCLLPELDAAGHHSASPLEQDHRAHPKALCDDHVLHVSGIGYDTDISTKAGVGGRLPSVTELPFHQYSVVTASELEVALLPRTFLLLRPSSTALYTLHSVYLI